MSDPLSVSSPQKIQEDDLRACQSETTREPEATPNDLNEILDAMQAGADDIMDAYSRGLQHERERLRLIAYRAARIFEPSMDGYAAAMAVYLAMFPEVGQRLKDEGPSQSA